MPQVTVDAEVTSASINMTGDDAWVELEVLSQGDLQFDLSLRLHPDYIGKLLKVVDAECWEELEGSDVSVDLWLHGDHDPTFANLSKGQYSDTFICEGDFDLVELEFQSDPVDALAEFARSPEGRVQELEELVRCAQHHVPRQWPQANEWLHRAYGVLGRDCAHSGEDGKLAPCGLDKPEKLG